MNSHGGGWEGALMGTILGFCLVAALVIVLVAGYLLVRAVNLVLRVLARYPRASRPLWLAMAASLILAVATLLAHQELLAAATAVSLAVAVLVARAIELANSNTFEEPASFRGFAHDVLHEWWQEVA